MENAQAIMELILLGSMLIYVLLLIIMLSILIYKILRDKQTTEIMETYTIKAIQRWKMNKS